jgi:uncharacterized protein YbjT (DUF2867 family)
MQTLVTGVSGYVGGALVPRLQRDGHAVRGFARSAGRVSASVDDLVLGDAVTGTGLEEALDGVDVAYYLIHSMEAGSNGGFDIAERRAAERFAEAATAAGVRRVVYLGGLVPFEQALSRHLGSRLAVEETLLGAVPGSIAFRASIVIAARSRSFRFLVRLVERLPVMALPGWGSHRTQPIDGRDMLEFLAAAATAPDSSVGSWDIVGPDVLSYGEMIARIADHMFVERPTIDLGFSFTPLASVFAARVAGEDVSLIAPLMESLESDLLPRDQSAAEEFGVRLHRFDAAVERALREWEMVERVRAR